MTKTHLENIEVCNQIIAQLGATRPFKIDLNAKQSKAFWQVIEETEVYEFRLPVVQRGSCTSIEVNDSNADSLYHILASYIAKHDLRETVVKSLGEVA